MQRKLLLRRSAGVALSASVRHAHGNRTGLVARDTRPQAPMPILAE